MTSCDIPTTYDANDRHIQAASKSSEALNSVLDAYQAIGEQIPSLQGLENSIGSSPHMSEVLLMMYKDILTFHGGTIRNFRHRSR